MKRAENGTAGLHVYPPKDRCPSKYQGKQCFLARNHGPVEREKREGEIEYWDHVDSGYYWKDLFHEAQRRKRGTESGLRGLLSKVPSPGSSEPDSDS